MKYLPGAVWTTFGGLYLYHWDPASPHVIPVGGLAVGVGVWLLIRAAIRKQPGGRGRGGLIEHNRERRKSLDQA